MNIVKFNSRSNKTKRRAKSALFILFAFLLITYGDMFMIEANAAVHTITAEAVARITPDKAFYKPGEPVTLTISAAEGSTVEATITHLTETLTTLKAELKDGAATLTWTPPATAKRGYGVDINVLDQSGKVIAETSSAFDVLDKWTQAPRYGFLSDFSANRTPENIAQTMANAAAHHVNGLQFYDWQYRHETLLPPTEQYSDVLNRPLSLKTVNALIDGAHTHNIAAMPYTAIYGASMAFYKQHPDWALFQTPGNPYKFGDNFLVIMNPAADSPWTQHLMSEFSGLLDNSKFDGIHIDQYGSPKVGRSSDNKRVDMVDAFPAFINSTKAIVDEKRGDAGAVIFNLVGNYPIEAVAPTKQDCVYIEVWSPYTNFMDLNAIVTRAQELSGGKPVIIAAYIHPDNRDNWRLANAIIFASGGYHLELGEPDAMLADPYFPKFGKLDDDGKRTIQRTYDFIVRYENVLALDTTDATRKRFESVTIDGIPTAPSSSRDRVAPIIRQGRGFETISLINLNGVSSGIWDEKLAKGPDALTNLTVTVHTDKAVNQIWWASPDHEQGDYMGAQPLQFTTGTDEKGAFVRFNLPALRYWDMVVLEE
jgi:dextranase